MIEEQMLFDFKHSYYFICIYDYLFRVLGSWGSCESSRVLWESNFEQSG